MTSSKVRITNPVALGFYLLIAIVLFGAPVLGNPATAHVGFLTDPAVMMWCMEWWPHAIAQGLNPFVTKAIWAPAGYNLTWATSIPAVAIVLAPLTALFGPVVSYNCAAILAPALSAWAAFVLCRQVTSNRMAALAGGAVYGFSPYEVGHALGGHLSLTPVLVPPLCVFLGLALVEGLISRRKFIVWLALLLVLQCLISTEVLATMTLFGAIALVAAVILTPRRRDSLLEMIIPIGCAYAAAALLLSPFLYFALASDAVPHDPIFPGSFFSADLLSFVVPGELMLIHPFGATGITSRFAGNLWENGSYFSLPLIGIAVLYIYPRRSEPAARILALLLCVIGIAALGPLLHVAGRQMVAMPWALADKVPLIRYALPARFGNYGFLVLAIILSLWISGSTVPFAKALTVIAIIAIVPNPAFLFRESRYTTPAFFAKGLYRSYLERGDNVLVIPCGPGGASMAWQAQSGMYFRMVGGYIGTTPEDFRRWPLWVTLSNSIAVPDPGPELKAFTQTYMIDAIVVADSATPVARQLPVTLGLKEIRIGGVSVYRLGHHADPVKYNVEAFQSSAADDWFMELLCGARRFTESGNKLSQLNPARASGLGLLPKSQWSTNLPLLLAGAGNGTVNGLWLGPGDDGTITVGLPASGAAVRQLVSRYGADATRILFPYPDQYSDALPADEALHFLVISLRPAALGHCRPGLAKWSWAPAK